MVAEAWSKKSLSDLLAECDKDLYSTAHTNIIMILFLLVGSITLFSNDENISRYRRDEYSKALGMEWWI